MFNEILMPIFDMFLKVAFFWSDSDTKRIAEIKNAREKILSGHDEILIDSTKSYLLLSLKHGLYLVSRIDLWKAKLGDQEEALYVKKGKKSFPRIRKMNNSTKALRKPHEMNNSTKASRKPRAKK